MVKGQWEALKDGEIGEWRVSGLGFEYYTGHSSPCRNGEDFHHCKNELIQGRVVQNGCLRVWRGAALVKNREES